MNITIRPWTTDDKAALMTLCNGADRTFLSNRLPFPYTDENADWWLNMVKEHDGVDGVFRAIAVDGILVGNISVEQKADVHCKDAEIGYLLTRRYWSRGVMTEAVRLICEEAFQKLDLVRITGLVYEPNMASCRVLEKNGFVLEGVMQNAVFKNGELYHLCVYGKLKR